MIFRIDFIDQKIGKKISVAATRKLVKSKFGDNRITEFPVIIGGNKIEIYFCALNVETKAQANVCDVSFFRYTCYRTVNQRPDND